MLQKEPLTKPSKPLSFKHIQIEDDVERLIILRKRLGKSQYEFAKAIGVTGNYLNNVENKYKAFTPKLKKKITYYLETRHRGQNL